MRVFDKDIIVSSQESTIDFEIYPFAPYYLEMGRDILKSREALICSLLRNLRSFNESIKDARKRINLFNFLKFPEKATIESLIEWEYKLLSEENRKILEVEINKILNKFKLGENWNLSIRTVILTNHIPIPLRSFGINTYFPRKKMYEGDEDKDLAKRPKTLLQLGKNIKKEMEEESALGIVRQWQIVTYPALYFSSRIKTTELISWIKRNKNIINKMNSFLPEETSVALKLDYRTERVATVAIIFKQDGLHSWSKMEKEILRWDKEDKDGISDFFGEDGIPTANDLRLCYASYLSALRRLDSSSES